MIFGQLASTAAWFAKFHAGTRKSQSDFWLPLLEQPIKFVLIDNYAKDGGPRWSDIFVVFTNILCGRNFCVWYVTKLKFTGQLQMASLSLYPQFETNLMSNQKVIVLLLQLKSAKAHGKNYIKVKPPLVRHLCVMVYY